MIFAEMRSTLRHLCAGRAVSRLRKVAEYFDDLASARICLTLMQARTVYHLRQPIVHRSQSALRAEQAPPRWRLHVGAFPGLQRPPAASAECHALRFCPELRWGYRRCCTAALIE